MMLVLLSLFACGNDEANTLEASSADITGCESEGGCASESSVLSVATGEEDGDWTVAAGDSVLYLHLPGHSDLSVLQGVEGTVATSAEEWGRGRSASIEDEAGLAFLLAGSPDDALVVAHFGESFVAYGEEELGRSKSGGSWQVHHPAVFQTDAGEVSLAPGEPAVIAVGGTKWRVVVIGSHQVSERLLGTNDKCGGPQEMLAFEMQRVEVEGDEDVIVRPAEKEMASNGCG